jgi:hypothetical protein
MYARHIGYIVRGSFDGAEDADAGTLYARQPDEVRQADKQDRVAGGRRGC